MSFENHVKEALASIGLSSTRNGSKYGAKDRGDLDVEDAPLVVQVKNTKTQALLNVLDDALQQAENAGVTDHVVVFRYRRGESFGRHERNAWCFPEWLALRMLRSYYLGERDVKEVDHGKL